MDIRSFSSSSDCPIQSPSRCGLKETLNVSSSGPMDSVLMIFSRAMILFYHRGHREHRMLSQGRSHARPQCSEVPKHTTHTDMKHQHAHLNRQPSFFLSDAPDRQRHEQ